MRTRTERNAAAFAIKHLFIHDDGFQTPIEIGGEDWKQFSQNRGFQSTATLGRTEDKGKFEDLGLEPTINVVSTDAGVYQENVGIIPVVGIWEYDMGGKEEGRINVAVDIKIVTILVPVANTYGVVKYG